MAAEPDVQDLIRELREHLGLFAGAMPIPPKEAWEEALERVDKLRGNREGFRTYQEALEELREGRT